MTDVSRQNVMTDLERVREVLELLDSHCALTDIRLAEEARTIIDAHLKEDAERERRLKNKAKIARRSARDNADGRKQAVTTANEAEEERRQVEAELDEARAKIDRLTARGIEDMQHELTELRGRYEAAMTLSDHNAVELGAITNELTELREAVRDYFVGNSSTSASDLLQLIEEGE